MHLDRLSRGALTERARIQSALQRAGALIRTPAGVIDLSGPDQEFLAELKGALARRELRQYQWRVEQTQRQKRREGQVPTGTVPFGYLWDKNRRTPVPHPDRFPLLVAACRDVKAASVLALAARCGVCPAVLLQALHSPVICGWSARRY